MALSRERAWATTNTIKAIPQIISPSAATALFLLDSHYYAVTYPLNIEIAIEIEKLNDLPLDTTLTLALAVMSGILVHEALCRQLF